MQKEQSDQGFSGDCPDLEALANRDDVVVRKTNCPLCHDGYQRGDKIELGVYHETRNGVLVEVEAIGHGKCFEEYQDSRRSSALSLPDQSEGVHALVIYNLLAVVGIYIVMAGGAVAVSIYNTEYKPKYSTTQHPSKSLPFNRFSGLRYLTERAK